MEETVKEKQVKAQELRIGNFVGMNLDEFPDNYFTMLEIAESTSVLFEGLGLNPESDRHYFDADLLEPIPLNEEWLLKFGFGKSDEHECGHNASEQFGFYYDWHFKRFWIDTQLDDGVQLPHIEYVHQLQNLFFALTGEELTLKDSPL